jgi:hypothetical protein
VLEPRSKSVWETPYKAGKVAQPRTDHQCSHFADDYITYTFAHATMPHSFEHNVPTAIVSKTSLDIATLDTAACCLLNIYKHAMHKQMNTSIVSAWYI